MRSKGNVKDIVFDSLLMAVLAIGVVGSIKNVIRYVKAFIELSADLKEKLKTE